MMLCIRLGEDNLESNELLEIFENWMEEKGLDGERWLIFQKIFRFQVAMYVCMYVHVHEAENPSSASILRAKRIPIQSTAVNYMG